MTEETIFAAALEKRDPAERAAFLAQACGRDAALQKRIETLLRNHEKMGAFLKHPAGEQMSPAAAQADVTRGEQPSDEGESDLGFLQPSSKPGLLGRLAHYEVLAVIGRGGCGIVLRAFDEKLHRVVAIKVMAPHLAATSPARKRFLREARSAAAVRHENVVNIYAVEDQPIPYLVTEYIAGETLQQRLDRTGPLEVPEVLHIGRQIAAGLAAAHDLGLIHRDIKPGNILLENGVEPRVKITDFGLARTADDASLTQSGVIAGTPLYMAPEQARGEPTDARADLFSLGSVLYVMCSGRPPFRAANTLAVLKRVAEDEPRPIREIIPEVPKWLCAIVARLHAKNPQERFASARDVADLLGRHLTQLQRTTSTLSIPEAPAPALPSSAAHPPAARPKSRPPALPAEVRSTAKKSAPPPTPKRAPVGRHWLIRRKALVAAALFLVLLAGLGLSEATGVTNVRGTVLRLFFPEGTLVVEVDNPDVSVTIDGEDTVITGAGIKEIRLKPGQYKVRANKDGKQVSQELITVSRNGRQVVRISTEAKPLAEAGKGAKPRTEPAPNPPAKQMLDVRFLPAAASAAVVVHPRRIVQSPLVAAALPAGAMDEMVKELGITPEQIEQAIVFLQTEAPAAAPPSAVPAAPPPPEDGWTTLDSKEGRFSVRFPVKPKESERKTTLGTRQVFTATDSGLSFEVSYVDFPKDSPIVGDLSRVDYGTRALEFKPGFKDKKDIKLDNHLGAEVVLDDKQLKTYSVHRVYVVGDRLYHLEASDSFPDRQARKPPAKFARFFSSFKVTGPVAPPPPAAPPELKLLPGAILHFAEPVDGKRILGRLLKGLREESRDGKTYYRSSSGEAILGEPLAGAVPDERTVLVAPEPLLRKMLTADSKAKSPLLDRLRQTDNTDEITGIVLVEPYRSLLSLLAGPFKDQLPRDLADAATLPDRLVAVTAAVNLANKTLLKVSLEARSEEDVEALDQLAFKGLSWARKVYPDFRPTLLKQIPADVVQSVLAIVDQLYGGIQVAKEGKRLIIWLEKPESLDRPPEKDLIASSGFNDARGMNSNPVPGSPFPLDIPNRQGGDGEPGWKGPWLAHPRAIFQSKVVSEGDGALFLQGSPNFGPNNGRQLAQAQTGKFQVEYRVQVPAGSSYGAYLWQDRNGGAFASGPNWGAGGGKFSVMGQADTGIKCLPGRWYKVTLRVDVAKQTWEFFVDDRQLVTPKPLGFRTKVQYLDYINFLVEGGVYIDDLRITRLPADAGK